MKARKTKRTIEGVKVFDWTCPNCLKQLYTDGKRMFCKSCNIEYDESEKGIKKYCSDFEERMLKEIEWTGSIFPTSLVPNDLKYNELLMAVESKYPGESRHETALRYIKDRENKVNPISNKNMSEAIHVLAKEKQP